MTVSGKAFKSIHPPEINFSFKHDEEDVLAAPYRKGQGGKYEDVISQNNYTNLYLKTVGEQLSRIEKISETPLEKVSASEIKRDNKGLFKPMSSEKLKLKVIPNSSSEMIEELAKRLKGLNIEENNCAPLNQEEGLMSESDQEDQSNDASS